jgi:hypothetical protein
MAVNHIRFPSGGKLKECIRTGPEHSRIAIEEIDLEVLDAGILKTPAVLRPIDESFRPSGRDDSDSMAGSLRLAKPRHDISGSAPKERDYLQNTHYLS